MGLYFSATSLRTKAKLAIKSMYIYMAALSSGKFTFNPYETKRIARMLPTNNAGKKALLLRIKTLSFL